MMRLLSRVSLLLAMLLAAVSVLPGVASAQALRGLAEGVDYTLIPDGVPYRPLQGKVEIAEFFAYGCHHCADMQPKLAAWKATLPAYVRVTYVPAAWRANDPYAQAFFAAEAAGAVEATHATMFDALHVRRDLPSNATLTELGNYYRALRGVNVAAFTAALRDTATIEAKVQNARAFMARSNIDGTPALIVNGRYLVMGGTHEALLRNAARIAKALAPSTSTKKPGTRR